MTDRTPDLFPGSHSPEPDPRPAGPARPPRRKRLVAASALGALAVFGGGATALALSATPAAADDGGMTNSAPATSAPTSGQATAAPAAPSGAPTPPSGAPTPPSGAPTPPAGAPTPPAGGPGRHQPHLGGIVKSASGSEILITDHEGFTRTIVVSSATKFSDGLSASVAAGTRIEAVGTVDANGTSLDATEISAPKAPPAGGPGPRAGGPAGPGAPVPPAPASGTANSSGTQAPGTDQPGATSSSTDTPSSSSDDTSTMATTK